MSTTPDELRALADAIESEQCTGMMASWCPVHGDCTCPRNELGEWLDADGNLATEIGGPGSMCPLHSPASAHAAAETFVSIYDVECPYCLAVRLRPCVTLISKTVRVEPHLARKKAYATAVRTAFVRRKMAEHRED